MEGPKKQKRVKPPMFRLGIRHPDFGRCSRARRKNRLLKEEHPYQGDPTRRGSEPRHDRHFSATSTPTVSAVEEKERERRRGRRSRTSRLTARRSRVTRPRHASDGDECSDDAAGHVLQKAAGLPSCLAICSIGNICSAVEVTAP